MTAKIRVLMADDHPILLAGLRTLIGGQPDLEVVAEVGNFPELFEKAKALRPEVITMDLSMPGGSGLAAIGKLRGEVPDSKILVLTMHDDPAYVRTALAAGANGYLAKSAADTALISAIRAVHRGRTFIDVESRSTDELLLKEGGGPGTLPPLASLSAREREVLVGVAGGHTNQAIADGLGLSVKTVESYRARLMQKLGLSSRAELTQLAIESGLLAPNAPTHD